MSPSAWRQAALALAAAALVTGCPHRVSAKDHEKAIIHHDLGIEAQTQGDLQTALRQFRLAVETDPQWPDARFALASLLQMGFHKLESAEQEYKKAIELKPDYSDAKVNLGTLYLEEQKYDAAIKLFDEALGDMMYRTPYIAQGNRGWALYKKGDVAGGIESIKSAVTLNSKYCMGYRELGTIYDEQGRTEDACRQYEKYSELCPEVAEAHFREGVCLAKLGKAEDARKALAACSAKADGALKDDCQRLLDQLQ